MTARRIPSANEFVNFETKLCFSLCHYPNIGLIAVIDRSRIRMFRSQPIIDTKNRNLKTFCPFSRIILVSARILTTETSTMKVDYRLFVMLGVVNTNWFFVQNSYFYLVRRVMDRLVGVVSDILSWDLLSSCWRQVTEFCIWHRVVLILLCHGQFLSQHWHIDLCIGLDWV